MNSEFAIEYARKKMGMNTEIFAQYQIRLIFNKVYMYLVKKLWSGLPLTSLVNMVRVTLMRNLHRRDRCAKYFIVKVYLTKMLLLHFYVTNNCFV